ncbi:MAG: hypothetical protein FWD87_00590 [Spirochaetaceae bacterium]|nr:hypothetical protein [Spirochaetaceae bacterium]
MKSYIVVVISFRTSSSIIWARVFASGLAGSDGSQGAVYFSGEILIMLGRNFVFRKEPLIPLRSGGGVEHITNATTTPIGEAIFALPPEDLDLNFRVIFEAGYTFQNFTGSAAPRVMRRELPVFRGK